MKSGAPVALAIGVGYFLGRTHKFKWALLLGTAAATGSLSGLPSQALQRGTKAMQSSPELAKIAESGQRLLEAGRTAAMSAMTSRAESMTDALEGKAAEAGERGTQAAKRVRGEGYDDEETDEYDEQEPEEDEDLDEDVEDEESDEESGEEQRAGGRRRPVVRKARR